MQKTLPMPGAEPPSVIQQKIVIGDIRLLPGPKYAMEIRQFRQGEFSMHQRQNVWQCRRLPRR